MLVVLLLLLLLVMDLEDFVYLSLEVRVTVNHLLHNGELLLVGHVIEESRDALLSFLRNLIVLVNQGDFLEDLERALAILRENVELRLKFVYKFFFLEDAEQVLERLQATVHYCHAAASPVSDQGHDCQAQAALQEPVQQVHIVDASQV